MHRYAFSLAAVMLAVLMLLCACAQPAPEAPVDVTAPDAAALPAEAPLAALYGDNTVTSNDVVLFFPEDATEATAQYKLSYSVPVFENEAINASVSRFIDELYTRVTSERLPLADRAEGEAAPYTTVAFAVQYCELPSGTYTNVIFNETASYGQSFSDERSVYAIVCDPSGNECSLAAVSGVYEPDAIVAQQVWNIIDREAASYFGDITTESIASALDLYNGFTVADEGYTVFVPAGVLADESRGLLEFSFALSALYPDFVGDVVAADDYERMLPLLNAAAAAFGPDYSGFSAPPTGAAAAAFMREYMLNGQSAADVSIADYTACYARVFGGTLTPESTIGVVVGQSAVSLTSVATALYRMQCEDAYINEDNSVTVTGELMCGTPGSGEAAVAGSASAVLKSEPEGWRLISFEIM